MASTGSAEGILDFDKENLFEYLSHDVCLRLIRKETLYVFSDTTVHLVFIGEWPKWGNKEGVVSPRRDVTPGIAPNISVDGGVEVTENFKEEEVVQIHFLFNSGERGTKTVEISFSLANRPEVPPEASPIESDNHLVELLSPGALNVELVEQSINPGSSGTGGI
jgi:hypothetical protein